MRAVSRAGAGAGRVAAACHESLQRQVKWQRLRRGSCILGRMDKHRVSSADSGGLPSRYYPSRWQIARELLVFNVKLALDGLKDIVLAPLSLVAGLIDIFGSSNGSRRHLHSVMRLGKGFDDWVDLYGPVDAKKRLTDRTASGNLDHYVNRVEKLVLDAHTQSKGNKGPKRDR